MARLLQELQQLTDTPRGQSIMLIKDTLSGFLEDYHITVQNFKADLVYNAEVSTAPTAGQIPRLLADGSLPAISGKNLRDVVGTLPNASHFVRGVVRLSDTVVGTSTVEHGIAATPAAVAEVNRLKPNITGATITGEWNFNNRAVFNHQIESTLSFRARDLMIVDKGITANGEFGLSVPVAREMSFFQAGSPTQPWLVLNSSSANFRFPVNVPVAPTNPNHLCNKTYVDSFNTSTNNNIVHKTGNETITGVKTFAQNVIVTTPAPVALELKHNNPNVGDSIIDFGLNGNDFDVRLRIRMPASGNQYGNIHWDFLPAVPVAQRQMFINGHRVWHAGNDGSGSGLDADTVDGLHSTSLVQTTGNQSIAGAKTFTGSATFNALPVVNNTELRHTATTPMYNLSGHVSVNTTSVIGRIRFTNRTDNSTRDLLCTGVGILTWKGSNVLTSADMGSGRGIDSDTVDGMHANQLAHLAGTQTITGNKTFNGGVTINNSSNENKFVVYGAHPNIRFVTTQAGVPHYNIGNIDANFGIFRDGDRNGVIDSGVANQPLLIPHDKSKAMMYGKRLVNETDANTLNGTLTMAGDTRINFRDGNTIIYSQSQNNLSVLAAGSVSVRANSQGGSNAIRLMSDGNGHELTVFPSFGRIRSTGNTFNWQVVETTADRAAVTRLSSTVTATGDAPVGRIQFNNLHNDDVGQLTYYANRTLLFDGNAFRVRRVTVSTFHGNPVVAADLDSVGLFGFNNSYSTLVNGGNIGDIWGDRGGSGLIVRGLNGIGGVYDSQNSQFATPMFHGLTIGNGDTNFNKTANFHAKGDYVNTHNEVTFAVNLKSGLLGRVMGVVFDAPADRANAGLVFHKGTSTGGASIFVSLRFQNNTFQFRDNPTTPSTSSLPFMGHTGEYWGMQTPTRSESDFIRTTAHGLIPDKSSAAGTLASLGTETWRFKNLHVEHAMVYTNMVMNGVFSTREVGASQTAISIRARVNNTAQVPVAGNFNIGTDLSGGGIVMKPSVATNVVRGKDCLFTVKNVSDEVRLWVGDGAVSTARDIYVQTASNGTGGHRVIHTGDGNRLLTSEPA